MWQDTACKTGATTQEVCAHILHVDEGGEVYFFQTIATPKEAVTDCMDATQRGEIDVCKTGATAQEMGAHSLNVHEGGEVYLLQTAAVTEEAVS